MIRAEVGLDEVLPVAEADIDVALAAAAADGGLTKVPAPHSMDYPPTRWPE